MYTFPDHATGYGKVICHRLSRAVMTRHSDQVHVPVVVISAEEYSGLRGQLAAMTLERDGLRLQVERVDEKIARLERRLAEQFAALATDTQAPSPAPQGDICGTISQGGDSHD